ncbi:hypothetical protein [Polynucleobacter necessarius]|uniref:hypothetical protein n=1 Tax=Polynucleobacter necessarius TaxID=576610 RepID=UPI001E3D45E1|nr:hypothetical protein [Polynucleobacter necessarius]
MRQARVAAGKESRRLQLVWVNTDGKPVDPEVIKIDDERTAGFQVASLQSGLKEKVEFEAW